MSVGSKKLPESFSEAGNNLTGSGSVLLASADRPSEKLMNRIAQCILYENLPTIAIELGISKAQLSCIKADASHNANVQRFEVSLIFSNFNFKHVVCTGPLTHGVLILPLGYLVWHYRPELATKKSFYSVSP